MPSSYSSFSSSSSHFFAKTSYQTSSFPSSSGSVHSSIADSMLENGIFSLKSVVSKRTYRISSICNFRHFSTNHSPPQPYYLPPPHPQAPHTESRSHPSFSDSFDARAETSLKCSDNIQWDCAVSMRGCDEWAHR